MNSSVIVFNAGSSSLKFSLFSVKDGELLFHGVVEDIQGSPNLTIYDNHKKIIHKKHGFDTGYTVALEVLLEWCKDNNIDDIVAAGHRVVHGGREFSAPVIINDSIMAKLDAFIPLAPLHQPYNLETIRAFSNIHPAINQLACFDTAFHRTMSAVSEQFALPKKYTDEGIIRYGFHGLSYEYISSVLPKYAGDKALGRIIIAHLGNGASMCAVKNGKSVATTMGFTALDGMVMGTRCGNIDPGVILYLMQAKNMSAAAVSELLYKESGLKGISGISNDMRVLLEDDSGDAKHAIDIFCHQAARQFAGLLPTLGGLDSLVFTAGIGEGAPQIRQNICRRLEWLGVLLDDDANMANKNTIHSSQSKVAVYMIPTDEEQVIANQVLNAISKR